MKKIYIPLRLPSTFLLLCLVVQGNLNAQVKLIETQDQNGINFFQVRDDASVTIGTNYFAGTSFILKNNASQNGIFYVANNDNLAAFKINADRRVGVGADLAPLTALTVRDSYGQFSTLLSARNNVDDEIFVVKSDGTIGVNEIYSDVIMNVSPKDNAFNTIFQVEKENSDDLFEINQDTTVLLALKAIGDFADVQYNVNTGRLGYDNSSRRSKRNVTTLKDEWTKILNARPVKYTRPNNDTRWEFGYIAEEMDDIGMTNLVSFDQSGLANNFNYEKMIIYVTEVLKIHHKKLDEIEALKTANDILSKQLTEMTIRLEALEQSQTKKTKRKIKNKTKPK